MENVAYKLASKQQQQQQFGHRGKTEWPWIETQGKTGNPTSFAIPSSHNNAISNTHKPRPSASLHASIHSQDTWDAAAHETSPTSSSSSEAPSPTASLPVTLSSGEAVVIRCNQHKWLRGEVKRLSIKGVNVKVVGLGLLVNVPFELLQSHLLKYSSLDRISSLPQAQAMLSFATEDPSHAGRLRVHCVRPAHLSHRQLCLILDRDICGVCREKIISEDEGVELWDCHHGCHLKCFRSRPSLVSSMTCPLCAEDSPSSQLLPRNYVFSNSSVIIPNALSGRLRTIDEEDSDHSSSSSQLETLPSSTKVYGNTVHEKSSGYGEEEEPRSNTASGKVPSLIERMKMMACPSTHQQGGLPQSHDQRKSEMDVAFRGQDAFSQGAWISVIKDGQDTRQNARQENLETMAKNKEKTFYKSGK